MEATIDTTTEACCASAGTCPVATDPVAVENSVAGFFGSLFDTSSYPARWDCGEWTPLEGWLHIVSDVGIFLAYLAIPSALIYCMWKRRDVWFDKILLLFAAFILSCGTTHLLEAIIFYYPVYRVAGLLKLTTAFVSWTTALVLMRMLPRLLELPNLVTRNELLERGAQAKSEFLANMSHEIRTPMTAILGYADVLSDAQDGRPIDQKTQRKALHTIKQNGAHLLAIINDVLDMSKIEASRVSLERLPTRIDSLVREVANLLEGRAAEKGLALNLVFGTPIPHTVYTDPTRVRQVILNLVGNSLKFTHTGSVTIHLSFLADSPTRGKLRIAVVDTGIGMTTEQLNSIRTFKPFVQADGSTTRKFGGTGLGLTISNSLAKLLGGRIDIHSKYNVGSTFALIFDAGDVSPAQFTHPGREDANSTEPETPQPSVSQGEEQPPLAGRRLLLVEDGPDNQALITFLLERAGAEVDISDNGRVGVDTAQGHAADGQAYDLILMDMQMPVLDGYAAIRELRDADYEGKIVALTAHAMPEDRQRCLETGADDYLSKPIDRQKLIDTCVAHCEIERPSLLETAPQD